MEKALSWLASRAAGAVFGWTFAVCADGDQLAGPVAGAAFAMTLDFTMRHIRKFY